jgi:hypothetical protein
MTPFRTTRQMRCLSNNILEDQLMKLEDPDQQHNNYSSDEMDRDVNRLCIKLFLRSLGRLGIALKLSLQGTCTLTPSRQIRLI